MSETTIVNSVDLQGRFCIPRAYRELLGILPGDIVELQFIRKKTVSKPE